MQRLGCSVNAAFRTRGVTAHDRNAGFGLQNRQRNTALAQRLVLQRERCVPDESQFMIATLIWWNILIP